VIFVTAVSASPDGPAWRNYLRFVALRCLGSSGETAVREAMGESRVMKDCVKTGPLPGLSCGLTPTQKYNHHIE
jgi:hypothetical protein